MSVIALTGGTGFVGARVIALALEMGHEIRALTRRPQPERAGVTWIEGALDSADALDRLVAGADAVLHVAGVVNAPDRAGFAAGNIAGTQAVVAAAIGAGIDRFVHVSSLAAREPALSAYGWSKIESESVVARSPLLASIIVRPPAIYGPGDMEMRDLFRMAKSGVALLPPGGRVSVIHVDDIAALLLALATTDTPRAIYEADDGRAGGWSHADLIRAIGGAVGRRPIPVALPKAVLTLAAHADALLRGKAAKLTPDRVGYLRHPDWTVDPAKRPDPALWAARIATPEGLAATAAWYRANGLL